VSLLDILHILLFPLKIRRSIWIEINLSFCFYPFIASTHDLHCRWPQSSWTGSRKIREHIRQRYTAPMAFLFFALKPTICLRSYNIILRKRNMINCQTLVLGSVLDVASILLAWHWVVEPKLQISSEFFAWSIILIFYHQRKISNVFTSASKFNLVLVFKFGFFQLKLGNFSLDICFCLKNIWLVLIVYVTWLHNQYR